MKNKVLTLVTILLILPCTLAWAAQRGWKTEALYEERRNDGNRCFSFYFL